MSTHHVHDQHVAVEIAWCPACRADCTVEVVTLDGDPGPVAVCVECGVGVETWWAPALPGGPGSRAGQRPGLAPGLAPGVTRGVARAS